jgi:3-methylfumaryl-CoA hydratase
MADLRDWIGREDVAGDTLTPALVARFAATLDEAPPKGDAAPLAIHLCLAPPAVPASGLGHDGHPALGGFLPPVPLPRRMWAGGEFAFHAPLRVGDRVLRRSVIRDVQEKQGRTGRLVFVTVDHALSVDGRLCITERQDIVYRDTGAPPPPVVDPAPSGQWQAVVRPDATLLFRYSALTFNGHRIHYDLDFARGVEGYPGLVVHGPLLATQLCRMAERLRGVPPARFRFRSLSTLFHDAPYALNAAEDGPALRLWAARPGGPVAMEAVADW